MEVKLKEKRVNDYEMSVSIESMLFTSNFIGFHERERSIDLKWFQVFNQIVLQMPRLDDAGEEE